MPIDPVLKAVRAAGSRFRTWLEFKAHVPPRFRYEQEICKPLLVQTGDELVNRVLSCIRLRQSVLLSGPRGSGKSRTIIEAIKRAETLVLRQGDPTLCLGGHVSVQGNREVGRDYLMTHEIFFEIAENKTNGQPEAVPVTLPSPLLKFTKPTSKVNTRPKINRDNEPRIEEFGRFEWVEETVNGDAKNEGGGKKGGAAPKEKAEVNGKFVAKHVGEFHFALFLDEVNRFPDGVLDSMLSLLEERTIFIEGDELKVPVTVLMTMNPPGYDATARQLSPPLMARIGRFWKLASPDLDTLSDEIVRGRQDLIEKTSRIQVTVDPILIRRVCLVTLCLWGDITRPVAGIDYLTNGTIDLLTKIMEHDAILKREMGVISKLSRYGPDGRAAAEWLQSAVGRATERSGSGVIQKVTVTERDFLDTSIEVLAHRIYDNFSPGSSPQKQRQKEMAIRTIVERLLRAPWLEGDSKLHFVRPIDLASKVKDLMPALCDAAFHEANEAALTEESARLAAALDGAPNAGKQSALDAVQAAIKQEQAATHVVLAKAAAEKKNYQTTCYEILRKALIEFRILREDEHLRWRKLAACFPKATPPGINLEVERSGAFLDVCCDQEVLVRRFDDELVNTQRYAPCRDGAEYETQAEHGLLAQWLFRQYAAWKAPVSLSPPACAFGGRLSLAFYQLRKDVDYEAPQIHIWKECASMPGIIGLNRAWAGVPKPPSTSPQAPLQESRGAMGDIFESCGEIKYRTSIRTAARWLDEQYRRLVILGLTSPDIGAIEESVLAELRDITLTDGQIISASSLKEEAVRLIAHFKRHLLGKREDGKPDTWPQGATHIHKDHFALAFLGHDTAGLEKLF